MDSQKDIELTGGLSLLWGNLRNEITRITVAIQKDGGSEMEAPMLRGRKYVSVYNVVPNVSIGNIVLNVSIDNFVLNVSSIFPLIILYSMFPLIILYSMFPSIMLYSMFPLIMLYSMWIKVD